MCIDNTFYLFNFLDILRDKLRAALLPRLVAISLCPLIIIPRNIILVKESVIFGSDQTSSVNLKSFCMVLNVIENLKEKNDTFFSEVKESCTILLIKSDWKLYWLFIRVVIRGVFFFCSKKRSIFDLHCIAVTFREHG